MEQFKTTLIHKITAPEKVCKVILLRREDGVITIGDDRFVKVWIKRDTGQYWPSICHALPALSSAVDFNHETQRLFVGIDSGQISEFKVADDYNSLTLVRDYHAHIGTVTALVFCLESESVLSAGRDKTFVWHCSETGKKLGSYIVNSWCTSLVFDSAARYAFVGDYSGAITVLSLNDNQCNFISKLSGHTASVRCLAWDAENQLLFSGSVDKSIIVWDIGGRKGTVYELHGHNNKVVSLAYTAGSKQLFSMSDDGQIVCWDLSTRRDETPEWRSSDNCQRCDMPFFWNVREMWARRIVGTRQHHCRKCGHAVCNACSSNSACIPVMGYEHPERVCDGCHMSLSSQNSTSLASYFDCKEWASDMYIDETQAKMVTIGSDKLIKIWDVSEVVR